MGLTNKQIQKAWDANFQAVQDAKAAVADSKATYARVCNEAITVCQPIIQKRAMGRPVDDADLAVQADQQERIDVAHQAAEAAETALAEAQERFKAGVVE